jgi:hypothetical protein
VKELIDFSVTYNYLDFVIQTFENKKKKYKIDPEKDHFIEGLWYGLIAYGFRKKESCCNNINNNNNNTTTNNNNNC